MESALLRFSVSGRDFAVPISDVDEVLRASAVRSLPGAPAHLLGCINLRGKLVPVIDLRRRLSNRSPPLDWSTRFVVSSAPAVRTVFVVDRVAGLLACDTDCEQPTVFPELATRCVAAVVVADLEPLPVLDLRHLHAESECETFEALLERDNGEADA